jgi:hypothetical protein
VTLNRGRAVHYPYWPESGFVPDPGEVASLVTPRTRAIVIINPNNPTGAVYPRAVLEALAQHVGYHRVLAMKGRTSVALRPSQPSANTWELRAEIEGRFIPRDS